MESTLSYLKDRYDEASNRFNDIELKCSRLLSFTTLIIALLTAVGGYFKLSLFSPDSAVDWLRLILFLFSCLCVVCAWGHSILALKLKESPHLPCSKDASLYIKESDETERNEFLFDCYVDTTQNLYDAIDEKSHNLKLAYNEIVLSAWFAGALSFISIINKVIK